MNQSDNDSLPDDVVCRLLEAIQPASGEAPAADLKARVMERVAQDARGPITAVRADEGEWREYIPGVMARTLRDDGRFHAWLARLEVGAVVPGHRHAGDEEILMLEGSCSVGGVGFGAGDYIFSPSGTWHEPMTTATGCLLFLRTRSPAAVPA